MKQHPAAAKSVVVHNVQYHSIFAAARALGVPAATAAARLLRGLSPEEAFTPAVRAAKRDACPPASLAATATSGQPARGTGKSVTVRGVTYPSITKAAAAHGWSAATIVWRMKRGWTLEEAFDPELRERAWRRPDGEKVVVAGKTYPSIIAAAEDRGVNILTVRSRMQRGLSLDEALAPETYSPAKPVTVRGLRYGSLKEAAAAYGINLRTVRARMNQGWPLERAFTLRVQGAPLRSAH